MKMNKEQEHCPLCGASEENFIHDPRTASIICDKCGCVVIERIPDLGQDWTEYEGQETSLRRTGLPSDEKGSKMTRIDPSYQLSNEARPTFFRLARAQQQISNQDERNYLQAKSMLQLISGGLHITAQIKESFSYVYQVLINRKYTRGRAVKIMVPAVIYLCFRSRRIAKTAEEIGEYCNINPKKIRKQMYEISKFLHLKIKPISYKQYISKFINSLNLSESLIRPSIELIKQSGINLTGRDPKVIAAGTIYYICSHPKISTESRTEAEIAKVAYISEMSLRQFWMELKNSTTDFKSQQTHQRNEETALFG